MYGFIVSVDSILLCYNQTNKTKSNIMQNWYQFSMVVVAIIADEIWIQPIINQSINNYNNFLAKHPLPSLKHSHQQWSNK